MKVSNEFTSPNFGDTEIAVEFVLLHYSAVTFEDTISLFMDKSVGASAHFVIDEQGGVFELVPALTGPALRAHHAGESKFVCAGKDWKGFNDFSIGIELINKNGNFFNYSDLQYKSLIELLTLLKERYPALVDPERILGHEHVAGFRGKVDPGVCFDWARLFENSYPGQTAPKREALCDEELQAKFEQIKSFLERSDMKEPWTGAFNILLESYFKQLHQSLE